MQHRLGKGGAVLDLRGTDFRNRAIEGTLYHVCLDGCDFRGATIAAYFDKVKGAKFDGAKLTEGALRDAEDCSFKNVTMAGTYWDQSTFVRCDFSGAKLNNAGGYGTTAKECLFKKADLSGAELGQSKFTFADFSGAILADAKLEGCDFTGANLSGADLSRADLRSVKFENADLRKARFKDAILSGADLTGATIDDADFTGARLTGANLTGLDLSKARNLEQQAARQAGPNMRELAKVANRSKRFVTSIEVHVGKDEYVILQPSLARYGSQVYVSNNFGGVVAPTYEQCMFSLTDLWSRGTPKFETVKVEAKQCPLRGKELHDLATAAGTKLVDLRYPAPTSWKRRRRKAPPMRQACAKS
jgi:uncharacterized protein YjbI with pentapeptide repeats